MKLSFKNVTQDLYKWAEEKCRSKNEDSVRQTGNIEFNVIEAYYQAKAYKPLVSYELGMNHIAGHESSGLHRLTTALIKERDVENLVRLWKGVMSKRKCRFWDYWSYRNKIENFDKKVDETKSWVMDGYRFYSHALQQLDQNALANEVELELQDFQSGKTKKLSTKPNDQKIDEERFWRLIEDSRATQISSEEQTERIFAALKEYAGPQIKKFNSILKKMMQKLYHWNVWALAYAAQDGCSDDAFEEFRAWAILQGRELCEIAIIDPTKVAERVPSGFETAAGFLLEMPSAAYELRTGKPLIFSEPGYSEPKGKPWEEEMFSSRYPQLSEHYERIRQDS